MEGWEVTEESGREGEMEGKSLNPHCKILCVLLKLDQIFKK